MGVTSFAYKFVLLLHITSAIIGFGGVLLNGVYANRAKQRPPAEALAVVEANTWVSVKVAEIFIYLTAVFGLGLVGLSDKVWKFSQTWVWVALVVYLVGLGISHGLLMPRVKKLVALMREGVGGSPTADADAAKLEPQIGGISMVLNLVLVVVLVLMIWKPGV